MIRRASANQEALVSSRRLYLKFGNTGIYVAFFVKSVSRRSAILQLSIPMAWHLWRNSIATAICTDRMRYKKPPAGAFGRHISETLQAPLSMQDFTMAVGGKNLQKKSNLK